MKDEKNDYLRIKIIFLLSIVASILMIIFSIPKAHALVMVSPNGDTTVNGTKYYYYNLPTRPNTTEGQLRLVLGTTFPSNTSSFQLDRLVEVPFLKGRNFDYEPLDNYISSNNIDLQDFNYNTTTPIPIGDPNIPKLMSLNWTFKMGFANSMSDMFTNGNNFYYNGYYTFTYDIALYSEKGGLGEYQTQLDPTLSTNYNGLLNGNNLTSSNVSMCSQTENSWSCSQGNQGYGYTIQVIYKDSYLQVIRVNVLFNQYMKYKFSPSLTYSNLDNGNSAFTPLLDTNYFNNNFVLSTKNQNGGFYKPVYIFFSEPYNLKLYTTEPSTYCDGSACWTQADTDLNSDSKEDFTHSSNDFISDFMSSIDSFISNDYGFSGIINKTFSFINNLLTHAKDHTTCYSVSVNFLGKDIYLPCGASFWNRQDMTNFNTTYNIIFIGALSYLLAWKIYKNLLETFNPDSKIVDGNEVDGL